MMETLAFIVHTTSKHVSQNVRIETEKRDLLRQLAAFREQSDQNASSLFLKTDTLSSLKRDATRLSAENAKLLKSARKSKARLKELDSEVSLLRDQNGKYEQLLNEARLNEDALATRCNQQKEELMQSRHCLGEYRAQYASLCLDVSTVQNELNEQHEHFDEIKRLSLQQHIEHGGAGRKDSRRSKRWRTMNSSKLQDIFLFYKNELILTLRDCYCLYYY